MRDTTINYSREVFLHPWNLTFLIAAVAAAFAFRSVDAFGLLLYVAMAAELLILGYVPRNKRFRKLIKAQKHAAAREKPQSEKDIYKTLSRYGQQRYARLRSLRKKIETNYGRLSYASQGLAEGHIKKLDGLLNSCLNLLSQQERYRQFHKSIDQKQVSLAIATLHEEMKEDPERVRAIKTRRLKVLEQRRGRFDKSHENLEIIDAQLETLEDVVKYIHEQSITLRNPEEVSYQLDILLNEMEETEASIGQMEDVFSNPNDTFLGIDAIDIEIERGERVRNRM